MPAESKSEKWIRYALILLAGILAALLITLFFQYENLERAQLVEGWRLRAAGFLVHHAPLPVTDATDIRSWMTFDYIDRLFSLPPDYLKAQLDISASSSYPRITIAAYAKKQNLNVTALTGRVEDAVQAYVPPAASSTAATSTAKAT